MELQFRYDQQDDYVEALVSGAVQATDLQAEVEQAQVQLELNDCSRFLSDFTNASVAFSIVDLFPLPDLQDRLGISRALKIAIVIRDEEEHRKLADFYVLVSANRGWVAKAFEARDDAVAWLIE